MSRVFKYMCHLCVFVLNEHHADQQVVGASRGWVFMRSFQALSSDHDDRQYMIFLAPCTCTFNICIRLPDDVFVRANWILYRLLKRYHTSIIFTGQMYRYRSYADCRQTTYRIALYAPEGL